MNGKWLFVFLVMLGCTANRSSVESKPKTNNTQKYFTVKLPPPTDAYATLRVSRQGQDGYEKEPTRVVVGDKSVVVALGDTTSIQFSAQSPALSRVSIEGQVLLVHARAGDVYYLGDDPCAGWGLGHERFDTWLATPPHGTCVDEHAACPESMTDIGGAKLARDPQCPDPEAQTGKRCLRLSTIEWRGDVEPRWQFDDQPLARTAKIEPRSRCFEDIQTQSDQFSLAIGIGEHWVLEAVDGTVTGTASIQQFD